MHAARYVDKPIHTGRPITMNTYLYRALPNRISGLPDVAAFALPKRQNDPSQGPTIGSSTSPMLLEHSTKDLDTPGVRNKYLEKNVIWCCPGQRTWRLSKGQLRQTLEYSHIYIQHKVKMLPQIIVSLQRNAQIYRLKYWIMIDSQQHFSYVCSPRTRRKGLHDHM